MLKHVTHKGGGTMLAHTKRLFQLSLITFFASLLFLLGSLINAQAETLTGTVKSKDTCWENGSKSSTSKDKYSLSIDLDKSALPFISAILTFHFEGGDEVMNGSGLAIPKNSKSGAFHLSAADAFVELIFLGKYKLDILGNVASLTGNFIVQDHNNLVAVPGLPCIGIGKAKLVLVN
jgi:hypothetical protein